MEYVEGAGLLYAAVVCVLVGRRLFNRQRVPEWTARFGIVESVALCFTGVIALAIAVLADAALREMEPLTALKLAAVFLAVVIASVATWRLIRRVIPGEFDFRPVKVAAFPKASARSWPGRSDRPIIANRAA